MSSIEITLNVATVTSQCDGFFTFGIGDNKYITWAMDFDGGLKIDLDTNTKGLFIYPPCDNDNIASGTVSTLISNPDYETGETRAAQQARQTLTGNNQDDWQLITTQINDDNLPISFKFTNDPQNNEFKFEFSSPNAQNGAGISQECIYNVAVPSDEDFTLNLILDPGNDEQILIDSFEIDEYVNF